MRTGSVEARSIEAPAPAPAGHDLEALAAAVARCTACGLHRGRTQTVFGCGSAGARWMVVGEGPGAEEDRQGLPFVGRAGQLLTAMLTAIGVARDAVYIANTVKCRPPQNRDPTPAEMAACRPFLEQQMALVQPALILAVGRIAAQSLLGTDLPLARLRGRVHRYPGSLLPVVATYHPAYLLRSPREKRKAWEDLLYARAQIAP
jgi:DNA polymerase